MVSAKFVPGQTAVIAYGLYQYDFGQKLQVEGLSLPEVVEIHFEKLSGCGGVADVQIGKFNGPILEVDIPDSLLLTTAALAVYIYYADKNVGETIRTVYLPILPREAPEPDVPDDKLSLLREMIELLRSKADGITLVDEAYLQLLSGKLPVGDRIRLPGNSSGGEGGREIELKNDGESICWRYTDSNDWKELVKISDLRGKDGITPEFEIRDGHLFAIYND